MAGPSCKGFEKASSQCQKRFGDRVLVCANTTWAWPVQLSICQSSRSVMPRFQLLFCSGLFSLSASAAWKRGHKEDIRFVIPSTSSKPRQLQSLSKDLLWLCDQRLHVLIPLVGSGTFSNLGYWPTTSNCWFMDKVFSACCLQNSNILSSSGNVWNRSIHILWTSNILTVVIQ